MGRVCLPRLSNPDPLGLSDADTSRSLCCDQSGYANGALINLLVVGEFVPVGRRDRDDLCTRLQVLCHAAGVSAVLVESNELWDFIVRVDHIDLQPRVVVQGICRTVL